MSVAYYELLVGFCFQFDNYSSYNLRICHVHGNLINSLIDSQNICWNREIDDFYYNYWNILNILCTLLGFPNLILLLWGQSFHLHTHIHSVWLYLAKMNTPFLSRSHFNGTTPLCSWPISLELHPFVVGLSHRSHTPL